MAAPLHHAAHRKDAAYFARQLHRCLRGMAQTAPGRAVERDSKLLSEQALALARTLEQR